MLGLKLNHISKRDPSGVAVEVWEWIGNLVPYITGHVIDQSQSVLRKGAPVLWA